MSITVTEALRELESVNPTYVHGVLRLKKKFEKDYPIQKIDFNTLTAIDNAGTVHDFHPGHPGKPVQRMVVTPLVS